MRAGRYTDVAEIARRYHDGRMGLDSALAAAAGLPIADVKDRHLSSLLWGAMEAAAAVLGDQVNRAWENTSHPGIKFVHFSARRADGRYTLGIDKTLWPLFELGYEGRVDQWKFERGEPLSVPRLAEVWDRVRRPSESV